MTRTRAYWLCQLAGWGLYVAITIFEELQVGQRDARTVVEPHLREVQDIIGLLRP